MCIGRASTTTEGAPLPLSMDWAVMMLSRSDGDAFDPGAGHYRKEKPGWLTQTGLYEIGEISNAAF